MKFVVRNTVIVVILTLLSCDQGYGKLRGSNAENGSARSLATITESQYDGIDWSQPRKINDMGDFLNICNNLIENGNAMNPQDPTAGWEPYGSGNIRVQENTFLHTDRIAVSHGPSQSLDYRCFAQGLRYEFIANMQILDENLQPILCLKNAPWGTAASCPLLVMKLEFDDGGIQWVHLTNTITDDWRPQQMNLYKSPFVVTAGMATAKTITIIITGPRAGKSIIFDTVGIYPKCKHMIPGGNADTIIPKNWSKWGASKTEIKPGGANGTNNHFVVSGRVRGTHGTLQVLPMDCITTGSQLEFKGQFKLIENDSSANFDCNIHARMWEEDTCVYLGILVENSEGRRIWHYLGNDAKVAWNPNDWNNFHRAFEITSEMVEARSVTAHIMGPRGGIDIAFDEIEMNHYFFPEMNCNEEMIVNGSFESAHFSGWETDGSGAILIEEDSNFGSQYSIKSIGRESPADAVKQKLDMQCFLIAGKIVDIRAETKLFRNGQSFSCRFPEEDEDANWDACPTFALEVILLGGRKRVIPLNPGGAMNSDGTFTMETRFRITEVFQWVREVYLQIRGISGTVTMYVDNVSMTPSAESNAACSELLVNQQKSSSLAKGWDVFGRGQLAANPQAEMNEIFVGGRTHHSHGLRQELDVSCFVRDERYLLKTSIELLDPNNNSYICMRNERWGSPRYCPLFSIQLISTGGSSWIHLQNDSPISWQNGYNAYESILTVTNALASAEKAYMYLYGPRDRVSMKVKDLSLEPYEAVQNECTEFINNGNAENNNLDHWKIFGRGDLQIINEGADGTNFAFLSTTRTSFSEGVKQELVVGCLVEGARIELKASMKLMANDESFVCDKTHKYGEARVCPLMSIKFVVPTAENGYRWLHIRNQNPIAWRADTFNHFTGQFVITSEMTASTEAYLYMYGPSPGVDIIFDEVTLREYSPPVTDCAQLIRSGDARIEGLDDWKAIGPGSLQYYRQGGDVVAYQHVGRTSPSHGPEQEISVACMTVGKQYEFKARLKLFEGPNMTPYACDKTVQGDNPLMCPLVSLRLNVMGLNLVENLINDYSENWKANDFNVYHSIFTVNPDVAVSESIFFYIRGPKEEVSIVFDDVQVTEYMGYEHDCSAIVKNGDAEEPLLNGWVTGGSGYFDYINFAGGSLFKYSRRRHKSDGPRQFIDNTCLTEGMRYDFEAKINLRRNDGTAFECDNLEQSRTDDFCVDIIFELIKDGEKQWERYLNDDPAVWSSNSFNNFRFTFTAREAMLAADEIYMIISGTHEDVDIYFDNVSITPQGEQRALCAEIVNGDAEYGDFTGWTLFNRRGVMEIVSGGANGSTKAFIVKDRTSNNHGPMQAVDLSCRQPGDALYFTFYYKLEDENNNPSPCVKGSRDPMLRCVEAAIKLENDDWREWVMLENEDTSTYTPGSFTHFRASFLVTQKMTDLDEVIFFLTGPREGVSIIFDEVSLL